MCRRSDGVAEGKDGFEGAEGGFAVVGFFGFRQIGVGDEAGVVLFGVVALGAVGPALGEAGGGPEVVGVFREFFS